MLQRILREENASPGGEFAAEDAKSRTIRVFFIVAGTIFLAVGVVGILLPILPTTPFLLLAAACYYKGSKRMHQWILNNRWFGDYIKNYREGRGISLKAKISALALLWITISYSAIFVVPIPIAQIILLIVAVAVSIHVITLPTFRKTQS